MKKVNVFLIILFISTTYYFARSFRVNQIPNGSISGCLTCHNSSSGGSRNSFGQAVQSGFLDNDGNVVWGSDLANLDSDGDGFTNGTELQDPNGEWTSGTQDPGDASLVANPGDASSFPNITDVEEENLLVNQFRLDQNYPNPFNPSTTISFNLNEASEVNLKVFNLLGEEVTTLIQQNLSAGLHQIKFDATNLQSGTYFYRIETNKNSEIRKMVLLK